MTETTLKTSDVSTISPYVQSLHIPAPDSHKGENGKLLVIGGSGLFHAASMWSAEMASYFCDMVHYASTEENNEVFKHKQAEKDFGQNKSSTVSEFLKTRFADGIVVSKAQIPNYATEDDAILLGPGMVRGESEKEEPCPDILSYEEILGVTDEAMYTKYLTQYLLQEFSHKRFVLDAGALQMGDPSWLWGLTEKPILTPHKGEVLAFFGDDITSFTMEEKKMYVSEMAQSYQCVINLKGVVDIISDGHEVVLVEGGNAGLTKGGTGDVLAGLTAALYTKNAPLQSAVLASYAIKKTAEDLAKTEGLWYNSSSLIRHVPQILAMLLGKK